MTGVVWEDPPPRSSGGGARGSSKLAVELRPLVDHPGRWARIRTAVSAGRSYLHSPATRVGLANAGLNWGEFEFARRRNPVDDCRFDVYARYVGPVATVTPIVEAAS